MLNFEIKRYDIDRLHNKYSLINTYYNIPEFLSMKNVCEIEMPCYTIKGTDTRQIKLLKFVILFNRFSTIISKQVS